MPDTGSVSSADENIYPIETPSSDTPGRRSIDVTESLQDSGSSLSVKDPDLFFLKQCPGYWVSAQLTSCKMCPLFKQFLTKILLNTFPNCLFFCTLSKYSALIYNSQHLTAYKKSIIEFEVKSEELKLLRVLGGPSPIYSRSAFKDSASGLIPWLSGWIQASN